MDTSTPAKIVAWRRHNKNLDVSRPRRQTIGRSLAALRVDLDAGRSVPRCSPSSPGPCLDYFLFRAPGVAPEPYGTGRGEAVRLCFAQIRSPSHLFVFAADAPGKTAFEKLTRVAARMLPTLRLPARLPARAGR